MPVTDSLGNRMKAHEHRTRHVLPRRSWTLVRVDGRAFHSYTRGLERPFDAAFAADMDAVAADLVKDISGAAFAYVQSDEISVLVTDFATATTEPWFGGVTAKITSLTAARATATLNQLRPPADTGKVALFDSRVFTLPNPVEVANYFVWRQRDAIKNSVAMAAQAHFSHRRLQGLHTDQLRGLLASEAGTRWEDYPDGFKYGRVVVRVPRTETVTWVHKRTGEQHTEQVTRNVWEPRPAPLFTAGQDDWLLATAIPAKPADLPDAAA